METSLIDFTTPYVKLTNHNIRKGINNIWYISGLMSVPLRMIIQCTTLKKANKGYPYSVLLCSQYNISVNVLTQKK